MVDMEWRCNDCGGRSFARVDERKPDGHFGPGPQVRCVNCKSVSDYPASPALPAVDGGKIVAWRGGKEDGSRKYTEIKRVSEIWADQGLTLIPLVRQSDLHAAESRIQSLEEEVKVLREALRPFADFSTADGEGFEDELFRIHDDHPLLGEGLGDDWHPVITVGDMRRARAALKENGNG